MAMIKCAECGNTISNMAGVCPHCGYPIQAIKNAQVAQKERKFYKELNKSRIALSIVLFVFSLILGWDMFRIENIPTWYWSVYFIDLAIVLFFCLSWIPYIIGIIVHVTQKRFHLTRFAYLISVCFGFAIGGVVGLWVK